MGDDETIVVMLANRCYLYQLMKTVFGSEPVPEVMGIVVSEPTRISLGFISSSNQAESALTTDQSLTFLDDLAAELTSDSSATIDRLKDEYTRLFIGPESLPAPPWESVYATKDRVLFSEGTLAVRRAYLEHGFLPKGYPNEPDDHISLELDFMFHLAEETRVAFEAGENEKVRDLLTKQQDFLQQHLLQWVDTFAQDIQASKTHYFYPRMALLAASILKEDAANTKLLLESLPG
jgi:TorA maturation chaperone TorD